MSNPSTKLVPISIYDHSGEAGAFLEFLNEERTSLASRLALQHRLDGSPLAQGLEEIEVTFLSDDEIGEVHAQFMDIPGATDVITFAHGEIVIGVGTMHDYAEQFGEPVEREALRYLVHGLLHLGGYEDDEEEKRVRMHKVQEAIVAEISEEFPF